MLLGLIGRQGVREAEGSPGSRPPRAAGALRVRALGVDCARLSGCDGVPQPWAQLRDLFVEVGWMAMVGVDVK